MSDSKDRLDALHQERAYLQARMDHSQVAMQKAVLGYLAISVSAAAVHWDSRLITDAAIRAHYLFALSQVGMLLIVFVVSQIGHQNVIAGYVAGIETVINRTLGETVNAWESSISPHWLQRPRSAFVWSILTLVVMLTGFFAFVIYITLAQTRSIVQGAVLVAEIPVVLALFGRAAGDIARVRAYSVALLTGQTRKR